MFQHTAARRRLGRRLWQPNLSKKCFNTQPPEGGWLPRLVKNLWIFGFNTQPPEGGWDSTPANYIAFLRFQHTAARRRLAVPNPCARRYRGFNTQPPEGGWKKGRVKHALS